LSDQGLSRDLQDFLSQHIGSVVQLELLLLLQGSAPRAWTRSEIARELRIDAAWAQNQASDLCDQELLECSETDSEPLYLFRPSDPALAALVSRLAEAYVDRRVSIISFIYSRPLDQLKSFADAFRLRKDKSDG